MDLTHLLKSTHAMHAASVHVPISLALLGVPLVILALLAPKRWPNVRAFTGAFYLLTSVIALAAAVTGQRAASELVALANEEIETVVAQHRLLGYSISALALVTALLFFASQRSPRKMLAGLATLNAFAVFAAVVYAGSSGGRLVYGFGIGTPVAGADGVSGATLVVGANSTSPTAGIPHVPTALDKSLDAIYSPKALDIDPAQAALVTFQKDLAPILERNCLTCHGGENPKAGLNLSTHAGILKGGDYAGPAVIPGDPDGSPMVLHIRGIYTPKMPKDAPELSEADLHTIRMWIAAGAKSE
jgi:uncharacterized membrane protein